MRKADVTIVISTKNRSADLRRALQSVVQQKGDPEIIVIDDGSDDDTPEVIKAFPSVTSVRHDVSAGYIVRRNQGAEMARSSFILSIDDDAELSDPELVLQVEDSFSDAQIGAVAIPCIEPLKANELFQIPPDRETTYVTDSFMGTAYALRRETFLKLGGFRESLIHQGEERDFAIRMMNAGQFVGFAHSEHIIHYESPIRNWARQGYFGRRNDVLYPIHNASRIAAIPHLLATTFNGLVYAAKKGPRWPMIKGLWNGWLQIPKALGERTPSSHSAYRLSRRLRKKGPIPMADAVREIG